MKVKMEASCLIVADLADAEPAIFSLYPFQQL
jgi:hypothetical protein